MTPRSRKKPKKQTTPKRKAGGYKSCTQCGALVIATYSYCDRCLKWLGCNEGRAVLHEELGDRMEAMQAQIDRREGR